MKKAFVSALVATFALPAWADQDALDSWLAAVTANQAEQPHWVTPLVTVTPRLEQEFRFDFVRQELNDHSYTDNFGNNKGLELIVPQANVELALNLPNYNYHQFSHTVRPDGYSDASVLGKYRVAAANEDNGNYIATVFFATSFPDGSAGISNKAAVYTPTLALGKGIGDFDVQSTLGYSMPDGEEHTLGHTTTWNTAFQYHFCKHYWPEIELNQMHYSGGANAAKTQDFVTTGIVTKWPLHERVAAVFGIGYQEAVTTWHTYNHALTATARLAF